ncbi:MAG: phage holin family protein [Parabacteroides sp.]|nr:phage holin family protein [Parabacteroides sp.]
MEKDPDKIIQELREDVSAFVELKLELLKLNTYERTGKVIAVLSYGLVLLFLAFFAILFIFLALGFFLGEWIGVTGAGFGLVAILYLLLMWLIIRNREIITTKVLNEVIATLLSYDEKRNETTNDKSAADADTAGTVAP